MEVLLDSNRIPLYNGWDEGHFMRIWVGVHPGELDNNRVLVLHNEIHMMLGTIRDARWKLQGNGVSTGVVPTEEQLKAVGGQLCVGWTDPKGLAALYFLHDLIAGRVFSQRQFTHNSDLMIPTDMTLEVHTGASALTKLFENGHHTGILGKPKNWPPPWITIEQRIADLKDLQYRWEQEGAHKWLNLSKERYGVWSGGLGKGERTKPDTINQEEVDAFRAHREAYRLSKAYTQ